MKQWQLLSIACLVALYWGLKTQNAEEVDPTTQAVAGACSALSELELNNAWQYDALRRRALDRLRTTYPTGSFTPPDWMIAKLSALGQDPAVSDVRLAYRNISEGLYPRQDSDHFLFGRQSVNQYPDEIPDTGICPDCDGSGKVGDGRVFTECLHCGGDGKLDTNLQGDDCPEKLNQKIGGGISRSTGGVKPDHRTVTGKRRVYLPRLRRLFGG